MRYGARGRAQRPCDTGGPFGVSELSIILVTTGAVVTLIYVFSSEGLRKHLGPVGRFAAFLEPRSLWLGVLTFVMFVSFPFLADNYGDAQLAADAHAFELLVPSTARRSYIGTACFDVVFAVVYGLLAFSLLPRFRSWGAGYRRFGSIGCGLLIFAALADLVENVKLLEILRQLPRVSDNDVDAMTAVGAAKWSFIYIGAALVIGTSLIRWLWAPGDTQNHMREWLRTAWVPYFVYLAVVGSFVGAAAFHQRWAFVVLVPAMTVCGSWLNEKVWLSRRGEKNGQATYGSTRVRLSVAQVIVGAMLVSGGVGIAHVLGIAGVLGDAAAFLGLGLVVMSLGSFLSELRHNIKVAETLWKGLLALAIVALAFASLVDIALGMLMLVVVGVVAGEVATELRSEIYLRAQHVGPKRWKQVGAGAILVGASTAWLIDRGIDPWHAVGLLVVLAVVVLMASADGDALLVVLLLAIALVASTRPGVVDVEDSVEAVAGEPYILILGDSYTSGEGATAYLPGTNEIVRTHSEGDPRTNECRQAPTAWPFQLVERVATDEFVGAGSVDELSDFPTRVLFLACSGAVTENIAEGPRLDGEGNQHGPDLLALFRERLDQLGQPALVIVGIGGNDAGFGDLGATCIAPGDCAEVADVFLDSRRRVTDGSGDVDHDGDGYQDEPQEGWAEALSQIQDDLRGTYAAIQAAVADEVPIVATAYPLPIATDSDRCSDTLLEFNERAFINQFATKLNSTIRTVSDDADVKFLDLSQALATSGSQLCASGPGPAGLNFFAFGSKGGSLLDSLSPKNWAHNSLHPTPQGHADLAEDAYRWFSANWPLAVPYDDKLTESGSDEDTESVDITVTPCDPGKQMCSIEHGSWTKAQAMVLFRQSIAPLAILVFALWAALLPLVAIGRDPKEPDMRIFNLMRRWREM